MKDRTHGIFLQKKTPEIKDTNIHNTALLISIFIVIHYSFPKVMIFNVKLEADPGTWCRAGGRLVGTV